MVETLSGLRIALLSRSEAVKQVVHSTLSELALIIEPISSMRELQVRCTAAEFDLVVIDDSCDPLIGTASSSGTVTSCPERVVLNVENEHRCAVHLRKGAAEAILVSSPTLTIRLLRAALRAAAITRPRPTLLGDVAIDGWRRRVMCRGNEVHLTPTEWHFLSLLAEHYPDYVSIRMVAGLRADEEPREKARARVQVCACYLRRKLRTSSTVRIESVRGVGYRLSVAHGLQNDAATGD